MKSSWKLAIKKRLVAAPGFLELVSWFTRYTPKFFMLHRFVPGKSDTPLAMSEQRFEQQLKIFKKGPWKVIALRDYLLMRQEKRKLPPYLVVLTIDDGYRDFYDVAYPLLKKYNFPATFFVTTEFVQGNFWLWHDRIHYALNKTEKLEFSFVLNGQEQIFSLKSGADRFTTWRILSDYCINSRNDVKLEMLSSLEKNLEVKLPESPPDKYAAVSWEQLLEMSANNIEIGSHTCTHPILSKIDTAQLEDELIRSKEILMEKLGRSPYSFCYPNGQKNDINDQVVEYVERAGYLGGVQGCNRDFRPIYRLPRIGIDNDLFDFQWKLCGLELLLNKHE